MYRFESSSRGGAAARRGFSTWYIYDGLSPLTIWACLCLVTVHCECRGARSEESLERARQQLAQYVVVVIDTHRALF